MNKATLAQQAQEEYAQICTQMTQQGYRKQDHLISKLKANLLGLLLPLPLALAVGLLFFGRWADSSRLQYPHSNMFLLYLLILAASVVAHELLHGIGWSLSCRQGWQSIRFHMMWSALMPYCHCQEVLDRKSYLLGTLLPIIILGGGFTLLSLIIPSYPLFYTAILNIFCAGGDLLIAANLRGYGSACIFDHPNECGFTAFIPEGTR